MSLDIPFYRTSEQAFRLLHQRYPNSEWAKKTKYWY
jgi:TolA-binding protein